MRDWLTYMYRMFTCIIRGSFDAGVVVRVYLAAHPFLEESVHLDTRYIWNNKHRRICC